MVTGDSNSGTQVCAASALLKEPSVSQDLDGSI